MQQRRECREKSGGVLEVVDEGEEAGNVEETREVEEVCEGVGEIDSGGEGSFEIAAGAGAGGTAGAWTVA
jgi:hypothetical protein